MSHRPLGEFSLPSVASTEPGESTTTVPSSWILYMLYWNTDFVQTNLITLEQHGAHSIRPRAQSVLICQVTKALRVQSVRHCATNIVDLTNHAATEDDFPWLKPRNPRAVMFNTFASKLEDGSHAIPQRDGSPNHAGCIYPRSPRSP